MSKQIVTYKYKLLLTQEQKCALWETINQYTEAYNIMLDCCFDRDDIKNHPMLHNEMYYEIREIFPDLNADYVNTCSRVSWETIKSQRALNRKKYKTAKRPPKSMFQSPRMTHHLFSYNIKNDTFSIASTDGRLKNINFECRKDTHDPTLLKNAKSAHLVFDRRHLRFFLHITVKVDYELQPKSNVIACDLGETCHIATYNDKVGYEVFHEQLSVDLAEKYHSQRQNLQSKGTRSAKRRLKALSKKQSRLRRDADHVLSKTLVEYAVTNNIDTIVLEDLTNFHKLRKKSYNKTLNRRLSSWSYDRLQGFIQYKATLRNINVDFVNPAYTSQACPNCGHISTGNRPQRDTFLCEACNYGEFADYIAAHNIFKLGSVSSP
jgi:IS605 OrfB family transposase